MYHGTPLGHQNKIMQCPPRKHRQQSAFCNAWDTTPKRSMLSWWRIYSTNFMNAPRTKCYEGT